MKRFLLFSYAIFCTLISSAQALFFGPERLSSTLITSVVQSSDGLIWVGTSKGLSLWNNYGLTNFNPCSQSLQLTKEGRGGEREVVDVTSTEGGKKEVRERNVFYGELEVPKTDDYSLLLDVGQSMARRHNLVIDGQTVIEMQNLWLPPTASAIVHLKKGRHRISAELTNNDRPPLFYNRMKDETVFHSPVAEAVDYTIFVGSPDEIIASYRDLTGNCPQMPTWALGYIHCRERFHSSEEILQTANRFRSEQMPVSVLVQDWRTGANTGGTLCALTKTIIPTPRP